MVKRPDQALTKVSVHVREILPHQVRLGAEGDRYLVVRTPDSASAHAPQAARAATTTIWPQAHVEIATVRTAILFAHMSSAYGCLRGSREGEIMAMSRFRLTAPAARLVARIVLAAVSGAVVGTAAYSISQTGGQLLSVVVGGLVGIGIAIALDFYRRSVQLSEVSLVVLGSTMTFTATTDMRQAAQRAFFQAATRVATRPLEDGSGHLREALASLKNLFDLYREPLESSGAPLPSAKGDSVHELCWKSSTASWAPSSRSGTHACRRGRTRRPKEARRLGRITLRSARSSAVCSCASAPTSWGSARLRDCATQNATCHLRGTPATTTFRLSEPCRPNPPEKVGYGRPDSMPHDVQVMSRPSAVPRFAKTAIGTPPR